MTEDITYVIVYLIGCNYAEPKIENGHRSSMRPDVFIAKVFAYIPIAIFWHQCYTRHIWPPFDILIYFSIDMDIWLHPIWCVRWIMIFHTFMVCDYLSMMGLDLIHVSKRCPRSVSQEIIFCCWPWSVQCTINHPTSWLTCFDMIHCANGCSTWLFVSIKHQLRTVLISKQRLWVLHYKRCSGPFSI